MVNSTPLTSSTLKVAQIHGVDLAATIASGCVPDRAGQPTQIQLHITLEDLIRRLGEVGSGDVVGKADSGPVPGWPPAAPGDECDASIVPVVTGCLDHDLLDGLMTQVENLCPLTGRGRAGEVAVCGRPLVRWTGTRSGT